MGEVNRVYNNRGCAIFSWKPQAQMCCFDVTHRGPRIKSDDPTRAGVADQGFNSWLEMRLHYSLRVFLSLYRICQKLFSVTSKERKLWHSLAVLLESVGRCVVKTVLEPKRLVSNDLIVFHGSHIILFIYFFIYIALKLGPSHLHLCFLAKTITIWERFSLRSRPLVKCQVISALMWLIG